MPAKFPAVDIQEPLMISQINESKQQEIIELTEQKGKELPEREKEVRLKWRSKCGLESDLFNKTFTNFKRNNQPNAYDIVKNLKRSLLLYSENIYGLGKTHLVAALVNDLINTSPAAEIELWNGLDPVIFDLPCPAYYVREVNLMDRIRATFNRREVDGVTIGETEQDVYSVLKHVNLLIIDDVGKIRPRDLSFLQSIYFRLIDDRYVNHKNIIFTTNMTLLELGNHIGGASADRLREMCDFVKMTGKSYRHK